MSLRNEIAFGLPLAFGLLCCGDEDAESPRAVTADQIGVVDAKRVVSRVGDVPLLVDDLRAQLTGRPQTTPREALQELISFELLVQEARRRKLHQHPDVLRAQKRALANLFVRREHGDKFTKQTIPRDLVEQAYSLNKDHYQRPAMVGIAVLFAKIRKNDGPEKKRAARRLMNKALSLARAKPPSAKMLAGLRSTLAADAQKRGVELDFGRINTARMRGGGQPLTDTAFTMKPGKISKVVVTTPRGYHIIYLSTKHSAINKPLSEVEGEIRDRIFEDARKMVFQRMLDKLWKSHQAEIFPDVLQQTVKQDQKQQP